MDSVDSSYVRPSSLPKVPLVSPRERTFVKSQPVHDKLSTRKAKEQVSLEARIKPYTIRKRAIWITIH